MTVKKNIDDYMGSQDVKNLLKLGWLTTLELVSLYKKAGNGLKKRTSARTIIDNAFLAEEILKENFRNIERDLVSKDFEFNCEIINDSCLNLDSYIQKESVNGVIFLHLMQILLIILKYINLNYGLVTLLRNMKI